MLFNKAIATMSLLTSCLAASVDLWAGPERSIDPRDEPIYQPIEPEEIIARLGTTPQEFEPEERHWGIVYFCREENWGPPCFEYNPPQKYACNKLNDELYQHVGSVFVEAGTICRFAKLDDNDKCRSFAFFAWPECKPGWDDLFQRESPGDPEIFIGQDSTHFMCAECTNCK